MHDIVYRRWLVSQTFNRFKRALRRRWIGGPWREIFERVKEKMRRLGARGGVVRGRGVLFRVVRSSLGEKPGGAKRVVSGESRGVEGGAT
ncbi:hypothetical protein Tco_1519642, partial [Tanacetum coccineum]